ncbi:hypothetical protein PanWU01x14_100310 [Parasponia andersonii]|uniref:Uncharacterized protein n=1 Tax=Parasponia andersonii TaxID=3476 RepID=A0A2P5D3L0_PARAD|nr:hypothetical protein PanWU01x14_100310 [Parasponia andersonii]
MERWFTPKCSFSFVISSILKPAVDIHYETPSFCMITAVENHLRSILFRHKPNAVELSSRILHCM